MPTMGATAFERLLHAREGDSPTKKPSPPRQQDLRGSNENSNSAAAAAAWTSYHISPALYVTPEPAAIPGSSPTPDSPSPYVLNHKRRDTRLPLAPSFAATSPVDVCENQQNLDSGPTDEARSAEAIGVAGDWKEEGGLDVEASADQQQGADSEDEVEDDDEFFDPRESMSVGSSSDAEDGSSRHRPRGFMSHTPSQHQTGTYFNVEDDFLDSSASKSSPFSTNIEMEMRAVRCSLLEEIEKRKKAEEALRAMHEQWKNIAKGLSLTGLLTSEIQYAEDLQLEINPKAVVQEILVSRLVSEAVERDIARAEAEAAAEAVIDAKDHEISRLRDRLQYYEAVNHEMSQRNQEAVESARQQRLRRKAKWKSVWGAIGLSVTIGASLLAYSVLPHADNDSSHTSDPDAASSGTTESGEY